MQPESGDAAQLRDMLQACEAVARFTNGRSGEDYARDDYLRSAVERQVEIIGEAARRISGAFRDGHPEVPWRPIIAQRHILAHEYGEVEDALIWRVATEHVPRLREQLRGLVPKDPPTAGGLG